MSGGMMECICCYLLQVGCMWHGYCAYCQTVALVWTLVYRSWYVDAEVLYYDTVDTEWTDYLIWSHSNSTATIGSRSASRRERKNITQSIK